jgi:amino acid transporter
MPEDVKETMKPDTDIELGTTISTSDVGVGQITTIDPAESHELINDAGYARRLSKRQIMMMTFGAGIGTGLWVGTGQALKYGKSASATSIIQERANESQLDLAVSQ